MACRKNGISRLLLPQRGFELVRFPECIELMVDLVECIGFVIEGSERTAVLAVCS